ncbi:MAG: cytochrome-c peroxidase, partial [Cytophagales bacterium]|nr:cytochrome-c peroxidase [Cytophagales bacterium]
MQLIAKRGIIFTALAVSLTFFSCKKEIPTNQVETSVDLADGELWLKSSKLFATLPSKKLDTSDAASAKIELGKLLYFDKRLSNNGTQSCNSCHDLNKFGVDNLSFSPGDAPGTLGGRNSPTSLNAYLHIAQFWDGRAPHVEAQAKGPILNPVEMGMPNETAVVERISKVPKYNRLYDLAYPDQAMNYDNLTSSIGFFERTLVTPSRFDKYLDADFNALTKEEKEGLQTFIEVGCPTCHAGSVLGGTQYQKFGVY